MKIEFKHKETGEKFENSEECYINKEGKVYRWENDWVWDELAGDEKEIERLVEQPSLVAEIVNN
jgi:hypothetical protein